MLSPPIASLYLSVFHLKSSLNVAAFASIHKHFDVDLRMGSLAHPLTHCYFKETHDESAHPRYVKILETIDHLLVDGMGMHKYCL